jgi:GT2 family glycosyltransferase
MIDGVGNNSSSFLTSGVRRLPALKSSQLGIGITTRDRWDDLAVTLSELTKGGYEDVETIVIDDGSKQPLPKALRAAFPKVRFERVDSSLGYVVQRNRLARMLSSTYYLSLDDDSFPVAGNINEAVNWLEKHPAVASLAFHVVRAGENIPSAETLGEPFPVQYFIGCGHLLRREQFLELGGYLDRLHYFNEEIDFCLKALLQGFSTYAYPSFVIRHNRTPVARNRAKATRYYIRNQAIIGFLYFPFPFFILRVLNCLRLFRNPEWNLHPASLLVGWLEAFVCAMSWRNLRRPLSLNQFRAWKKLPLPTQ